MRYIRKTQYAKKRVKHNIHHEGGNYKLNIVPMTGSI